MALPRDHRIARGSVDLGALPLTPQEFFVLSRVEGTITVREVLAVSGLPASEAEPIVTRLVELGALQMLDSAPAAKLSASAAPATASAASAAPSASPVLRDKARERRLRMLQAQLGSKTASAARPPEARPSTIEPAERTVAEASEPALERVPFELAPFDDARLDGTLAIPKADQRLVLGLIDRLETMSPFQILGIAPTDDIKMVRRAFHEISRRLHPDTYYGRDIGPFGDLLARLFQRAKLAQHELRDPSVREPFVTAHREQKERAEQARRQEQRAREEADEARRRQAEGEARVRRQTRAAERIEAERRRAMAAMDAEAARHVEQAEAAEKEGALAMAANLYRMALQCRPDDVDLEARWQACLARARTERAATAFSRALECKEVRQHGEATKLFVEAAEAHPTAEHLAHAADAVRMSDPVKARAYAMAALEALGAVAPPKDPGKAAHRGALHLMIARAFLAVGQRQSAREQALVAQRLRPNDKHVRALLNSIKVT